MSFAVGEGNPRILHRLPAFPADPPIPSGSVIAGIRLARERQVRSTVIAYENNQTDLLDLLDSQMAVIDVIVALMEN